MQKSLNIYFVSNKKMKAQELLNEMIVKIMETYKVTDQLILTYVNEENITVSIDTQEKYIKFLGGQTLKIIVKIKESGIIIEFNDQRHEFEKKQSFQELKNQLSQKFKIKNWEKYDLIQKNGEEIYIILNEEIYNVLINQPQLSLQIIEYLFIKKDQFMKKIKKVTDFQEFLASIKMAFSEIQQFKLQYTSENEYFDLGDQEEFDIYLEDCEQNPIVITNLLTIKINDNLFKITRNEQYDELQLEIAIELKILGEYTLGFLDGIETFDISNQEEYDDYLRNYLSHSPIFLIQNQAEKPKLNPKASEVMVKIPEVLIGKPNLEFRVQQSSQNDYVKPKENINQNQDQNKYQDGNYDQDQLQDVYKDQHQHQDKNKDQGQDQDQDYNQNKYQDGNYDQDQLQDVNKDQHQHQDKNKDQGQDQHQDYNQNKYQDGNYDQDQLQDVNKDQHQHQDKNKDQGQDQHQDYNQNKYQDGNYDQDQLQDVNKDQHQHQDKNKDQGQDQHQDYNQNKYQDGNYDQDQLQDVNKDQHQHQDKNKDQGQDQHQDYNQNKYQDGNYDQDQLQDVNKDQHQHQDKNKDQGQDQHQDYNQNKYQDGNYDQDQLQDVNKDQHQHQDKNKDQGQDQHQDYNQNKYQDGNYDQDQLQDVNKDQHQHQDKNKDQGQDQHQDYNQNKYQDGNYDQDQLQDVNKDQHQHQDKNKDQGQDQHQDYNQNKYQDGNYDQDQLQDVNKDQHQHQDKNKDQGQDQHQDYNQNKYQDGNYDQDQLQDVNKDQHQHQDKNKDQGQDQHQDYNQNKYQDENYDQDQLQDVNKDLDQHQDKNKDQGQDQHQDYDQNKYQDGNQEQNQLQDKYQIIERQGELLQDEKILFENLSEEQKFLFKLISTQYLENDDLAQLQGEIDNLDQEEMELLIKYFKQEYKQLNFSNQSEKQLKPYDLWLSPHYQCSLTKMVSIKDFGVFQKEFNQLSNLEDQKDLYQHCQVHLDQRLALGQDFKSFFQLPVFVQQPNHPLYGYDDYKMLIFFCEKMPEKSIKIFYLYNKIPGLPLPFIFNSPLTNKLTMPVSSFSEILGISNEKNLISLGPQLCGKSKLLNLLFKSKFHEFINVNKYPEHYGVQAIFNSDEYQMGFNIFDFQMNFANNDQSQEQKERIGNILKLFSQNNTKLLLHSKSYNDLKDNLNYLLDLGWQMESIKILIRDTKQITILYKQLDVEIQKNMLTISKIENNNQFEAELALIRIKIIEWIQTFQVQQIENQYQDYESRAQEIKNQQYQIQMLGDERIQFSKFIRAEFKKIDVSQNIHQQIFKVCRLQRNLNNIDKELGDTQSLDDNEKRIQQINKLKNDKRLNELQLNIVALHNLVYVFDLIIRSRQTWKMNIFSRELSVWSQPIIDPLFTERKRLISQKDQFDDLISKHQRASNLLESVTDENQKKALLKDIKAILEIQKYEQVIKQLEIDKIKNSQQIDSLAVSKEHFFRELNASYDLILAGSHTFEQLNREQYLYSLVEFVRQGMEIEFIDGENNKFHEKTIGEIFKRLENKYQKIKPFVISIIGPQSTGKSTLLNFLFKTNFQMSAGRCTKGMYASYFETDCEQAKRVIVLDTKGLLSIEKNDPAYDKKVTAFNMALSQILLINIMGDFNQAMKEIIQMSLLAGQQLKISLNKRPILIFVLRNCIDDNVDKMKEIIDKIGQELIKVAKATNMKLHDIVDYRGEQSFCLMYSAFNKDDHVQNGKKLYSICLVNDSFRNRSQWLLEKIFKEAENEQLDRSLDLKAFTKKSSEAWQALGGYNSLLSLKSIQEKNLRQELQQIVNEIRNQFVQSGEKKLQNSLNEIEHQDLFTSDLQKCSDQLEHLSLEYQIKVQAEFEKKAQNINEEELKEEYKNQLIRIVKLNIQRVSDKLERNSAFEAIIKQGKDAKKQVENYFQSFLKENGQNLQKANQKQKEQLKNDYIVTFQTVLNGLIIDFEQQIQKMKQSEEYFVTYTIKFLKYIIGAEEMGSKTFLNYQHVQDSAKYQFDIKLFQRKIDENDSQAILNQLWQATEYNYNYFYNQVQSLRMMRDEEQINQQKQLLDKLKVKEGVLFTLVTAALKLIQDKNKPKKKHQYYVQKAEVEQEVQKVLILKGFPAFFQIQSKIFESIQLIERQTSINTSFIQNLLRDYEETISSSQKQLSSDKVNFKKGIFEQKIAQLLFNCILKFYVNEQENQIIKQKKEFNEEMEKLNKLMKNKLESFLGDQKIMVLIGEQIFENFTSKTKKQAQNKQIEFIQQKSKLEPSQLQALGDQLITQEQIKDMTDQDFQDWATNITDYLSKLYDQSFKTTIEQAKKLIHEEAKKNLISEFEQLICRLTNIQSGVSNLIQNQADPGNINSKELGKIQFRLFLAMLTENDKIKDILMKLNSQFKTNITNEKIDLITNLCAKTYKIENLIENPSILDDSSIQNLSMFLTSLINDLTQYMVYHTESKIITWLSANVNVLFDQRSIDEIKWQNKQEAIGCREVCPYCGAKCTVPVIGGQNHDGNHQTNYHRVMGLRGSHQLNSDTKALELITFCCTTLTAQKSIWKDSPFQEAQTSKQSLDANIRQMVSEETKEQLSKQKCTMGALNFTISWTDPNDLDLFVTCPCGSKIGFGSKCAQCEGYSDLDMNFQSKHDPNTPVEHIFFPKGKEGKYKVFVRMYQANKTYEGKKGGETSKFKLDIHKPDGQSYLQKEFTVGGKVPNITEIFDFFPKIEPLSFQDHLKKHYPQWTIIEGQQISNEAISLQGSLIQEKRFNKIILKQTKLTQ